MPKVPQSKRQVSEQGIGNVRSDFKPSAEALGGGSLIDSRMRDIDKLSKVAVEVLDDFDKTEVKKARRELQTFKNKREQEFKLLKNKMPSDQRIAYDEEWNSEYSRIAQGLGSGNQRKMFGEVKADFDVARNKSYGGHQLSEAHNYQNDEDVASIESDGQTAAQKYDDPDAMAGAKTAQKIVYHDMALRLGDATKDADGNITLTKDGQKNYKSIVSQTHVGITKAMLADEQDIKAENYYKQIKNDKNLTPEAKAEIQRMTETGSRLGTAQRFVDAGMTNDEDMGEMIAKARSNPKFSSKTKEFVVGKIKQRFQEKKNITVQKDNKLNEESMKLIRETNGNMDLERSASYMGASEKMKDVMKKWQNQILNKERISTNKVLLNSITVDMFQDTPAAKKAMAKFTEEGPWQYRPYLNNNDYAKVEKQWKSFKDDETKKSSASEKSKGLSRKQYTDLKTQGFVLATKNSDNVELKYEYHQAIDNAVAEWESLNGGNPIPRPELVKIVDTATMKTVDTQLFGSDSKFVFQTHYYDKATIDLDSASDSTMRRARERLHRKGNTSPSDDDILKEIQTTRKYIK